MNPLSRKLTRSRKEARTLEKKKRIFKEEQKYSDMLKIYNGPDRHSQELLSLEDLEPQSVS